MESLSGLAIALVIHSVDPSLSSRLKGSLSHSLFSRLKGSLSHSLFSRLKGSLSHSLFSRLKGSLSHSLFSRLILLLFQKPLMECAITSRLQVSVTVTLSRLERTFSTSSEIALEAVSGVASSRARHTPLKSAKVRAHI